MNPATFTLLIPHKLPALLKDKRHLQRITATLLLLRSRFPEGRFNFCDMKEVSELCGFKSRKGFKNHLDALQKISLLSYQKTPANHYVTFADWKTIKKYFNYDRNYFVKNEKNEPLQVQSCTTNNVLGLLISLAVQSEQKYFHQCLRANLNGNPELREAIENVCGDVSRAAIHNYQLKAFTEGLPRGMSDEYYEAAHCLLHAMKTPKAATADELQASRHEPGKARRFLVKGDINVSVGYLSRSFGGKNRNYFCYWKKKLQVIGLAVCSRREYRIEKGLRTTTGTRTTGIGLTYFDPVERCLKLRLTDAWTFISPEVAFSRPVQQLASKLKNAA